MILFIAEKPELARAIVNGLGGGKFKETHYEKGPHCITWCIGHLLALCDPKDYEAKYERWRLEDFPFYFYPVKYKPVKSTQKQLKAVLTLIKKADSIVHAGDPDGEGQVIVDELIEYSGFTGPVKRFLTNDNNDAKIKEALDNLKDNSNFKNLSSANKARSIADQLFGYNMTCVYTLLAQDRGFNDLLTIGRVQTPILSLIYNRQKANESHQKIRFFDVVADFDGNQLTIAPESIEDILVEGKILDRTAADSIISRLDQKLFTVTDASSKTKSKPHPLCFNMLKLQIMAAKAFSYTPDQVMAITQSLREKHKLIAYNGTDCQYLNMVHHQEAPDVIKAICNNLNRQSDSFDTTILSRTFNDAKVSAHHAMIPTTTAFNPDDLTDEESNIYTLIAEYYLAQFMPKNQVIENSLSLAADGLDFRFKKTTHAVLGFRELIDPPESASIGPLFDAINTGDEVDVSLIVAEKITKPLPLYSFSTLLAELPRISKYVKNEKLRAVLIEKDKDKADEHGGIGTARTRGEILSNLIKRKLVTKRKNALVVTEKGQQLIELLPEVITSPDMSALWHEQLAMIEAGKLDIETFIKGVYDFIATHIDQIDHQQFKFKSHDCPECGAFLRKMKSKKGLFWGCSSYPKCRFTAENKKNMPVLA